ncbi:DUF2953 domain-containing protein [Paenibacillus oralis]|uniref:DUF2953 domain-containing protein n=1 Tax=Paenibacillus oralis TaxID=2490856 RepID=A0A3P3U9L4_9BACL|nr:DUF2953 domain-containing protein [Paenibacillus oralis]RRJ66376.1 DUF2953 domain-containing protein [Paenibacillus oralis]
MWIWLGGILILLLLVIFLILMSKVRLRLFIRKVNSDDTIKLDITMLYGLISMHYQVPSILLKNWREGLEIEQERSENMILDSSSKKQSVDKDKVNSWIDNFERLMRTTKGLKKWMSATLRRVTFQGLEWSTNVALDDAAHTATLTGALWGLKATLVGWLSRYVTLQQRPKLFVVPVFGSKPLFSTELSCIAEIRCGYAIYAGLVLIVRVLKVKGGVKKWLTILSKG